MNWTVTQARQRFSAVLRAAEQEPQRIYNRRRPVAAVVDGATFERFHRWAERSQQQTIGERFAELRQIRAEEGAWELASPDRKDRLTDSATERTDAKRDQLRVIELFGTIDYETQS